MSKISGISIYSPQYKTPEGIGVGSTFGDLKSKYTIDFISTEGESGLEVQVKSLKIFFILDNSKLPKEWWETMDTNKIPDSVTIEEIIL
jgi:hypothetical protein